MTGGVDRSDEREGLVAEALAELEALRDREGHSHLGFLALLFGVDFGPLGLVAGREKRLVADGHRLNRTPNAGDTPSLGDPGLSVAGVGVDYHDDRGRQARSPFI
jgi:hypothetical protein